MTFKKIKLIIPITITLLLISFSLTEISLADTTAFDKVTDGIKKTSAQAGVTPTGDGDLATMAGKAINYFFGIVAIVFLTVITIGGYLWMAAGGNEENVKKAKTFILNGIFGMMVIFIAYGLVALILFALKTATTGD